MYGAGLRVWISKRPWSSQRTTPRRFPAGGLAANPEYQPSSSVCQMSTFAPASGVPSVAVTWPARIIGVPGSSSRIGSVAGESSWTCPSSQNGPRMVPTEPCWVAAATFSTSNSR